MQHIHSVYAVLCIHFTYKNDTTSILSLLFNVLAAAGK